MSMSTAFNVNFIFFLLIDFFSDMIQINQSMQMYIYNILSNGSLIIIFVNKCILFFVFLLLRVSKAKEVSISSHKRVSSSTFKQL